MESFEILLDNNKEGIVHGYHLESVDIKGWRFWEFHKYLAQVVLVALIEYKNNSCGYPHPYSEVEWNAILDKMIYGFNLYVQADDFWTKDDPREQAWQEAKTLFTTYWECFWD